MRFVSCMMGISLCASLATAQRRPMWAVPPSRAISTLTTADSTSLVEAAARHVVDPTDAARRCILGVIDSVGGHVGSAFLHEARRLVAARPPARDSASSDHIALLGLRDGDTVAVVLRHSGSARVPRDVFWQNVIDYYFVRDTATSAWRLVSQRLADARDYESTSPTRWMPLCRNARANL